LNAWKLFQLNELKKKAAGTEPQFQEFLRGAQISCAIYRLPAGAKDMQAPHFEDEVYVVLEGRAQIKIDGEIRDVAPDMVLFVGATTEHSFFDIKEDLTLLAFFGPANTLS
jgi:mannose-6-phosphate isomerase-like protein (cupin superfamily)